MTTFQLKITCHTKNQEKPQTEFEQSIDTHIEMSEKLELPSKGFKVSVIKLLQWAITDMLETNLEK